MKTYNVTISKNGEFTSSFQVVANNLKEAKQHAGSHKRLEKLKGRLNVTFAGHE